ncbi:MAG: cyclase family protein [Phycisphaerales bacterium]|nr:cyclase family protein [Phycisphaerales bacterium]
MPDSNLIDITHDIIPGSTSVWPGDTAPTREVLMELDAGDSVTLSTLHSTVHLGTHADGPCHYGSGHPGVGEMSLEHYIGPCRVIRIQAAARARVTISDLGEAPIDAPRILIDTGTFHRLDVFNEDFAALDPELIDHLAKHGVITVGLDSPSVDIIDSKDLPAHGRCLANGMAILETLKLADVTPGRYDLYAQPLKLMGFDGSPVRAVLRQYETTAI